MSLWASRFKEFCRDAVIPPAMWRALSNASRAVSADKRKADKNKSQYPYIWDGDDFELAHDLRHVAVPDAPVAMGITRARDTRAAIEVQRDVDITVGPFPDDTVAFTTAFAQARTNLPYADLSVTLDGKLVTQIKGPLIAENWNNIRVAVEVPGKVSTLRLSWSGERLYLSQPVPERVLADREKRNNVIVLVLDSMVPETVGCLSGASPEESFTPQIDRYFAGGQLCTNAYSQSEYTMPSLATMMTGLYPIQHGVFTHDRCQRTIPPQIPTLAEFLQDAGYRTFAYSTGCRYVPPYGHYRGFERFHFHNQSLADTTDTVVNRAMEFIETHKDSPTFCFLHIIDPHPPFALPTYFSELNSGVSRWGDSRSLYGAFKLHRDSRERVADLREMERVMVRNLDFILGKLFGYLEREGLDKTTDVMVLADHGREYMKGSPLLTRSLTRIPFLLTGPGVKPGVCDGFVEPPIDLYPTIAGMAGLAPPPHLSGRNAIDPEGGFRTVGRSESLFRETGEIVLREDDCMYALRFPLDDLAGEGDFDAPVGEWLFRRDPETKEEDMSENLLESEPETTARFRQMVREHYEDMERHFSNDSIIDMTRDYPK
jgi:hypothetical protein